MEFIIKDTISRHIDKQKLLRKNNYGFFKRRPCLTNLYVSVEGMNKSVEKGDPVGVVYLDLHKAFNKVPH